MSAAGGTETTKTVSFCIELMGMYLKPSRGIIDIDHLRRVGMLWSLTAGNSSDDHTAPGKRKVNPLVVGIATPSPRTPMDI
jgi:hypothetical protein